MILFSRRVFLGLVMFLTSTSFLFFSTPANALGEKCYEMTEGKGSCIPPSKGKSCYGLLPYFVGKADCGSGLNCCSQPPAPGDKCKATTAGAKCQTECQSIGGALQKNAGKIDCPQGQVCCQPIQSAQKLSCEAHGGQCTSGCVGGETLVPEAIGCVAPADACCKSSSVGKGSCKDNGGTCLASSNCSGDFMTSIGPKADCVGGSICCVQQEGSCKANGGTCLASSNCSGDFMASIGPKADCPTDSICCVEKTTSATPTATTAQASEKAAPSGVMTSLWLPPCISDGNCDLNAIVSTGVYFAQFLMGLSGALFFGIFVYGGVLYLASFGNKSYVEKGKKAIQGAALGIVIVMGAYVFVTYLSDTLKGGSAAVGSSAATKEAPIGADSKCTAVGEGWSCVTFKGDALKAVLNNAAQQGYETTGVTCPGDFHTLCAKLLKK